MNKYPVSNPRNIKAEAIWLLECSAVCTLCISAMTLILYITN